MYHYADEDVSLFVPLIVGGEYVTPDVGTASYRVRGNAGTLISGPTPITTDANTTAVTITVPGAANAITKAVENRFVVLDFQVGGAPHRIERNYKLTAWAPVTASFAEVRAKLGVTEFELPDQDIDLLSSYLFIKDELGTVFTDALTDGSTSSLIANDLVAIRTALAALPSLQLRVMQSEKSDVVQMSRPTKIDYPALHRHLTDLYAAGVSKLTSVAETTLTLFTVATRSPDPFTGA